MIPMKLTNREAQIASIAGRGYTSKYIANLLCMSARTVETHLGRIYGKLAIDNRDELIDYMRGVPDAAPAGIERVAVEIEIVAGGITSSSEAAGYRNGLLRAAQIVRAALDGAPEPEEKP